MLIGASELWGRPSAVPERDAFLRADFERIPILGILMPKMGIRNSGTDVLVHTDHLRGIYGGGTQRL